MTKLNRRALLQLLILGGLSRPAHAFWFSDDEDDKPQSTNTHQQIHRLKGSVTVNNQPATTASIITPGDEIITGENTEFVFHQGKDAYLLRSNTRIKLEGQSSIVDALRIVSGAVLSVFGSGNKQIITPVATAGIRGTGTYFEVDDETTYMCTCYGETRLTSNTDPDVAESLSTTHHESPRYVRSSAQGSYIEEAPAKNHTDAELIMLEATVGREPPFKDEYDPDADYAA